MSGNYLESGAAHRKSFGDAFASRLKGEERLSLQAFVAAVADTAAATGVVLARPTESGAQLELAATVGIAEHAVRRSRVLPGTGRTPLAKAAVTGNPVFARGSVLPDELATGTAVALPLVVGHRLLAVLGLDFARKLEREARERLVELGEVAALAFDGLDREILEDRGHRLQELTAALAPLERRTEIAQAIVSGACAAVGAAAGSVTLLDAERTRLRFLSTIGYRPQLIAAFDPMSLDLPTPLADAARSGDVIVIETTEEFDETYPEVRERRGAPAEHAVVAIPLAVDGPPIGTLGLSFTPPRLFQESEIAFMLALARLCAQALDRAERGRRYDRMTRLQVVTAELARALTPVDVGRVVVEAVAAVLDAHQGRVVLVDDAGTFETMALTGGIDDIVERLGDAGELDGMPFAIAITTGKPLFIPSLDAERERYPVAARELGALGYKAVAAVPLHGSKGVVGSISLKWHNERRFTDDDVSFFGAIAGVCAQALERARAHEHTIQAEARYRHLLDHLGEALVVVDESLTVRYANEEATQLFGDARLVDSKLPDRWPELRLRELVLLQIREGAEPQSERATLVDGRTLELVATREERGVAIVLRDISRRERQERAEHEFISNAAHELRTPLAAIGTAADALARGAKDIPAERDFYISGIVGEVERLVRLSDALLLLSRAQSDPGTLRSTPLDLEPLVTEIAARLEVRPGVRVTVDGGAAAILGERSLLEGALTNIARNAARHTERGTIHFACASDGTRTTVSVSDTGPGMEPSVRDRATSRFFRGGDRHRDGFGLGLAIASEMVRVLGGELEIESRPGAGTIVTMSFEAAT